MERAEHDGPLEVLLVEDNDEHAILFERLLSQSGGNATNIRRARNLRDGIRQALRESVSVAVLDLGLPESRGLDTLLSFRHQVLRAPVVVLTSTDSETTAMEAIRAGAQDYLYKGDLSPGIIRRAIQYAVERYQLTSELERSNTSLNAFAAAAAHDLVAPLRHIGCHLQILVEDFGDQLSEGAQKRVDQTITTSQRLRQLIESLLDFSRHGSSSLETESCAIRELVDAASSNLASEIESSGARIIVASGLPRVSVDRALAVRVFQNLIDNGIKYVERSAPEIHVTAVEKDGKHEISIRDNGIGIDPGQLGMIFEPLKRLHAESRYPGFGLGLASCARIAQAHGGNLRAESAPGLGSTFVWTVPAVPVYVH